MNRDSTPVCSLAARCDGQIPGGFLVFGGDSAGQATKIRWISGARDRDRTCDHRFTSLNRLVRLVRQRVLRPGETGRFVLSRPALSSPSRPQWQMRGQICRPAPPCGGIAGGQGNAHFTVGGLVSGRLTWASSPGLAHGGGAFPSCDTGWLLATGPRGLRPLVGAVLGRRRSGFS